MKRRKMTVRPSESMMKASRVFSGVFAVVGICFVIIGVTQVIPSGAGIFGIVWTVMAGLFTGIGVAGVFSKKGAYFMYGFQIEEESQEERGDAEGRLKDLQALYDQRLITSEEYEQKRKEILKEL